MGKARPGCEEVAKVVGEVMEVWVRWVWVVWLESSISWLAIEAARWSVEWRIGEKEKAGCYSLTNESASVWIPM